MPHLRRVAALEVKLSGAVGDRDALHLCGSKKAGRPLPGRRRRDDRTPGVSAAGRDRGRPGGSARDVAGRAKPLRLLVSRLAVDDSLDWPARHLRVGPARFRPKGPSCSRPRLPQPKACEAHAASTRSAPLRVRPARCARTPSHPAALRLRSASLATAMPRPARVLPGPSCGPPQRITHERPPTTSLRQTHRAQPTQPLIG